MVLNPDIVHLIEEIRDDRTHGAIELARQAARVLSAAAENTRTENAVRFLNEIQVIGGELISTRPSMVPIRNIVTRLLSEISNADAMGDVDLLRKSTISRIDRAISESLQSQAQIISYARELVDLGDIIMTHSYSSTVVAFLEEFSSQLGDFEVYVTRSGPGRSGEEIARRLADSGVEVAFIDDTAVGQYMPMVAKVLLGADTVSTVGVLNGVGSYQVAVLAARHGVPVYVLADTLKFGAGAGQRESDVEERDIEELVNPARLSQTVSIKNPHFDVTPLELISMVVTEQGVMTKDAIITLFNNQSTI